MSSIALNTGQSHFHYGPDLPFEDDLFFDPLDPDTDGDNVTDGKEINGYDLVWMETMSDGSVKDHKLRAVKSDPLDPTNGWRDTDGDGMPDYKEVHYEEFYPFIVNWANNQHRQNPNDFNATEYLSNQFNPFVRENIPPMLLSMSVTTVTEDVYTWVGCCGVGVNVWTGWNTYADIRARIYDVGGFSMVKISGPGGTVTFSSLHNGWYNTTIDVGFWEAATEYTIKLDAKDTAGNELKYDYTVKGLFAGVLDFLRDIWNAVTSIVKAAWEAVKSAVDFIVEWIKEQVTNLIKGFTDTLTSSMQDFSKYMNTQLVALEALLNGDDANFTLISDILTSPLFKLLMALPAIILSVYALVTVSSCGLGSIVLDLAGGMVISMIVNELIGTQNSASAGNPEGNSIIDWIFGTIGSAFGSSDSSNYVVTSKSSEMDKESSISSLQLISIVGALLGIIIQATIYMQTKYILEGKIFQKQGEISSIEEELEMTFQMIRGLEGDARAAVQTILNTLTVKKANAVVSIEKWQGDLEKNKASSLLGIVFGIISLVVALAPLLLETANEGVKATLFGLSIGMGIGAIITSLGGLRMPGVRFLSTISIALSSAGIGISLYNVLKEG